MGSHHSKPNPPNNPNLPGDCPTIFECHWKRAQVSARTIHNVYKQDPMAFHMLMCFFIFMLAVVLGVTYYRVRRFKKNDRALKQGGAHHIEEEKGYAMAFSENIYFW